MNLDPRFSLSPSHGEIVAAELKYATPVNG